MSTTLKNDGSRVVGVRWETVKKRLMEDPQFRAVVREQRLQHEIAEAVIRARLRSGMTQAKLAKKCGTKQTSISRLENGRNLPSLSFLKKVARVLGVRVYITLEYDSMANKHSENLRPRPLRQVRV